jgi:cell division protein FtsW
MEHTPKKHALDFTFLGIVATLSVLGFFIFASASLGLLARGTAHFSHIAFSQLALGAGGGILALLFFLHIPYRLLFRYAPHAFLLGVVLSMLVFVPVLGSEVNGAHRWIFLGGLSLQPAEFLKFGFVLCVAWYYGSVYKRIENPRFSLTGLLVMLLLAGVPLLLQPDTGTLLILVATGSIVAFSAGVPWKHVGIAVLSTVLLSALLVSMRPYLLERVDVFLHPSHDPQGAGYQIKQSFIATGSGGIFGRGFGKSVQKFGYLPEPTNDSIFSVYAEEMGFVGAVFLLGLFLSFAYRGLRIASHAPDRFSGFLVVGFVSLIMIQVCMNISAMIGIFPLTGEPLVFVSQGGTSLFFALASAGIILNISHFTTKRYTV